MQVRRAFCGFDLTAKYGHGKKRLWGKPDESTMRHVVGGVASGGVPDFGRSAYPIEEFVGSEDQAVLRNGGAAIEL
jgi:hypothetical protein